MKFAWFLNIAHWGITQLTSLLSKWMEEIPFSSSRITVWTNSELMIWITSCTLTILHNPLPHWTSACQHKRQYSPLFRKALFNLNLMVTEKLCCFCIENLQLKEQRTFKLLKTFTFLIIMRVQSAPVQCSERKHQSCVSLTCTCCNSAWYCSDLSVMLKNGISSN